MSSGKLRGLRRWRRASREHAAHECPVFVLVDVAAGHAAGTASGSETPGRCPLSRSQRENRIRVSRRVESQESRSAWVQSSTVRPRPARSAQHVLREEGIRPSSGVADRRVSAAEALTLIGSGC